MAGMARFFIASQLSERIAETPEGYLLCEAVPIARTGELAYAPQETPIPAGDGQTIITRGAADLFAAETLASFEGKPVTLEHPPDFVTPDTWKQYAVGTVQNVRQGEGADSDKLLADLLLTDARAIEAVRTHKLRELSCGYDAEYFADAPGKGRQTNIRGNHVALVAQGRCGSACAIQDAAPGAFTVMKKKLLGIFGKALDEALPDAETLGNEEAEAMEEKPAATDAPAETGEEKRDAEDFGARLAHIEEMLTRLLDAMTLDKAAGDEKAGDACGEEKQTADAAPCDAETAARAEILAPGIAKTGDVRGEALKAAYKTADGKAAIDTLLAGRAFDAADETLFIGAAELLKAKRMEAQHAARATIDNLPTLQAGAMTPEKINELNAARYGRK